MQVEIYIDVVFIINLIMNLFILICTQKMLKLSTKWYKILISSALCSFIYCLSIIFIENNIINIIILSFVLFTIPILISFSPKSRIEFIKIFFTLVVITFITGGTAFGLYYMLNTSSYMQNYLYLAINNFPFMLLLVSVLTTYIFSKVILSIINMYFIQKQIYNIQILYKNNSVILKGIIDTGNSLYDPISLKPVIIVEKKPIQRLINLSNERTTVHIPFNSIGKEGGMLIGIKCDRVKVFSNIQGDMIFDNPILGIYDGKISSNGDYSVLLNSRMF